MTDTPPASSATNTNDTVHLSASTYSVEQSAGTLTITVSRTPGVMSPITIDYDTADGTAIAGTDYTAMSGTLQWAENDSSDKSITIPVNNAVTAETIIHHTRIFIGAPAEDQQPTAEVVERVQQVMIRHDNIFAGYLFMLGMEERTPHLRLVSGEDAPVAAAFGS